MLAIVFVPPAAASLQPFPARQEASAPWVRTSPHPKRKIIMLYRIERSSLAGSTAVTTSKSHTMRAILLATMATGNSRIRHSLPSPDTAAMITACRALGAEINAEGDELVIQGTGGRLSVPDDVIDVGNSGQVLRFGASLAALLPGFTVITGDASVRTIRPMEPLLEALTQLGAFAVSSKGDGHAPVIIRGPAKAGTVIMDGADSQPVSAILFLAAFLQGVTRIEVRNPGEIPWIDLTLHWLDRLGVRYDNKNYRHYTVYGTTVYGGYEYTVPGDWSSAAFPIAAALVTGSQVILSNMDTADPQGDKAILDMFERMGARFAVNQSDKTVSVLPCEGLSGITVDVNAAIDAVPVLAAVACFADSPTVITGASIARHKESDRISAMAAELGKMGAHIEESSDGMKVVPAPLYGARVNSRHDHRIAMACAVAGMGVGNTIVEDTACVAKSFPGFAEAMRGIGANITEEEA